MFHPAPLSVPLYLSSPSSLAASTFFSILWHFLLSFLVTLLRKQLLKCQLGEKFASFSPPAAPFLLLFKLTALQSGE